MRAIILAAGQGSRLKPLTDETPKCLLVVGGKTILDWQLDNLAYYDLEEVIIVTGFKSEMVVKEINKKQYRNIRVVENKQYAYTNNVHSLKIALNTFDDSFILLNGDTVFHRDILDELIGSHYPNVLAIRKKKVEPEEMQVILDGDKIIDIGKDRHGCGEFTGIAVFRDNLNEIQDAVRKQDPESWFEDALRNVRNLHSVNIGGIPYIEIDFKEDLKEADEIFKAGMPDWEIGIRHGSNIDSDSAFELLCDVVDELDGNGIKYWINFGTLLGFVRDGDFIPWDTDIDVTCHMKDRDKVIMCVEPKLKSKGCWVVKESVCFKEDRWYTRDKEKVELNFVEDAGDKYIYSPGRCNLACPKEYIDNLGTINFNYYTFNIPSNVEKYLKGCYGEDWKTPIVGKKPVSL